MFSRVQMCIPYCLERGEILTLSPPTYIKHTPDSCGVQIGKKRTTRWKHLRNEAAVKIKNTTFMAWFHICLTYALMNMHEHCAVKHSVKHGRMQQQQRLTLRAGACTGCLAVFPGDSRVISRPCVCVDVCLWVCTTLREQTPRGPTPGERASFHSLLTIRWESN